FFIPKEVLAMFAISSNSLNLFKSTLIDKEIIEKKHNNWCKQLKIFKCSIVGTDKKYVIKRTNNLNKSKQEFLIANLFDNAHIIKIYQMLVDEEKKRSYLVMDF